LRTAISSAATLMAISSGVRLLMGTTARNPKVFHTAVTSARGTLVSTIRLAPVTETDGTFIEWFAEFDSEAADEAELMSLFGDGVFGAGLSALREHTIS